MRVTLNGEPREFREALSVADLVTELRLDSRRLAVEINQEVVPRGTYPQRRVAPGDVIEIVQFIGGG